MLTTKQFLRKVVTSSQPGYFVLATGNGHGGWLEQWYKWPEQIDDIVSKAEARAEHENVYFSTYLFKAPQSVKENVLPTRTIQADLDDADATNLPIKPNVLVETSPNRHQGYWILDRELPLEEHESLSRKLTYGTPLCDRSGWALGRKVRIPGTFNHKYLSGPKKVYVKDRYDREYTPDDFEPLPEVAQSVVEHFDEEFVESPETVDRHPLQLLDDIANAIPVSVYMQYNARQTDRSEALWALMCNAFKAGLNRSQVFTLAKGSANNKFVDLKHRADQGLAKDVLRAEIYINSKQGIDPRQLVHDLFNNQLTQIERKRAIFSVVFAAMKEQGHFLHSNNGYGWYIRRDTGRPIAITAGSDQLAALIDVQYGLNHTEPESQYVKHGLKAYVNSLPEDAVMAALSHYDPIEQHMLLHTGRKTVLRITKDDVEQTVDGAYNVIFPWGAMSDSFIPDLRPSNTVDWGEELFGNGTRGFGSSIDNVINMPRDQAYALMKVWFMFLLFRNVASSRPILAAFGSPGSGKTSMFRKMCAVLFGRYKSLNAVTSVDDFDYATATEPVLFLDNVDTWEKWLPDRLALSAGLSDVTKRKLYTDVDVVTMRRQAMIGVTAHAPKFGREDVADRFLLFMFSRFTVFKPDSALLADLYKHRNAIWGSIIRDIQKVLAEPVPVDGIPQFRIEDFARYGLWIARAIGVADSFLPSVERAKDAQKDFVMEEEGLLVGAITKWVESDRPREHRTASQLWTALALCASDQRAFEHAYRNSVVLSKKLSSMQPSLNHRFKVEQGLNAAGARTWLLAKKEEDGHENNSQ